jgi:hypothetical protein
MARGYAVCFDPADPNRVYLGADSAYSYRLLRVTTDLGVTWQRCDSGLTGYVLAIAVAPDSPDRLYCGTSSGLYRSTNSGMSWTLARSGSTQALAIAPEDSRVVYAGTSSGVFVTTDAGATWQPFNTGLTNLNVLSLALMPGALFAGTAGSSVFVTTPLTGLAQNPGPGSASKLDVSPNPCRGDVVVRLPPGTLASSNPILRVFDSSGRLVRSAGIRHSSLVIPGLTEGAYVLRLTAGGGTTAVRLVVVR